MREMEGVRRGGMLRWWDVREKQWVKPHTGQASLQRGNHLRGEGGHAELKLRKKLKAGPKHVKLAAQTNTGKGHNLA